MKDAAAATEAQQLLLAAVQSGGLLAGLQDAGLSWLSDVAVDGAEVSRSGLCSGATMATSSMPSCAFESRFYCLAGAKPAALLTLTRWRAGAGHHRWQHHRPHPQGCQATTQGIPHATCYREASNIPGRTRAPLGLSVTSAIAK